LKQIILGREGNGDSAGLNYLSFLTLVACAANGRPPKIRAASTKPAANRGDAFVSPVPGNAELHPGAHSN